MPKKRSQKKKNKNDGGSIAAGAQERAAVAVDPQAPTASSAGAAQERAAVAEAPTGPTAQGSGSGVWDLLGEVSIADLEGMYSNYDTVTSIVVESGQSFAAKNSWDMVWCPTCNVVIDSGNFKDHVVTNHTVTRQPLQVWPEFKFVVGWGRAVRDGEWHPVNTEAAYELMRELGPNFSFSDIINQKWPRASENGDLHARIKLVEEIRQAFRVLLWTDCCVTPRTIQESIQYAMDALNMQSSLSEELLVIMRKAHLPILFLNSTQLQPLLEKLQKLSIDCGKEATESSINNKVDLFLDTIDKAIEEGKKLKEDLDILGFDCDRRVFLIDTIKDYKDWDESYESIRKWLCRSPLPLYFARWKLLKKDRIKIVKEFLDADNAVMDLMQQLIQQKELIQQKLVALDNLHMICKSQVEKTSNSEQKICLLWLLKKRREGLVAGGVEQECYELGIIKDVFEKFGCWSESGMADMELKNSTLLETDDSVLNFLLEYKQRDLSQVHKLDSKIMRSYTLLWMCRSELQDLPDMDYRVILVPLIKPVLKMKLRNLLGQDVNMEEGSVPQAEEWIHFPILKMKLRNLLGQDFNMEEGLVPQAEDWIHFLE